MPRDPHKDQPILGGGAPLADAIGMLVLVHGRGGTPDDMRVLRERLERPRWSLLLPVAAARSWYPFSLLEPLEKNAGALNSALRLMSRTLAKAVDGGVLPERVVLLGFSQGACVVLEFVARNARRYGAVAALSGGLIGPEGTIRDYAGMLDGTPVFLGCGDRDLHVPKRRVDETEAVFERFGARVTRRIYPGLGYAVNEDEIQAVRGLLDGVTATAA